MRNLHCRYLHCLNACATCAKLVLALHALPLRLATCTTPVPTLLVLALHYLRTLPLCLRYLACATYAFPVPALSLCLRFLHCSFTCATCTTCTAPVLALLVLRFLRCP